MTTTYSQYFMRTAIHSGAGARVMLPDLFKGLGAKRVVLYSDHGLKKAGIVDEIIEIFHFAARNNGPVLAGVYLDTTQDATSESVNAAAKYAREVAGDSLLAVGGGSVLDTVKGVKYALHHGLDDIKTVIPGGLAFESWPEANLIPIPHISVPTTAGTGSEVSPIAVIYNEEMNLKTNLIHPFISSCMAVLDPELTVGLPPKITAFTGFDALTHAIEGLASSTANGITDAYGYHAIRLINEYLPKAVKNGHDLEARMNMLQASTLGIISFSYALCEVPVHNFAHAYGALFRIPHGLANAVFLPEVMEQIPEFYERSIEKIAKAFDINIIGKQKQEIHQLVVEKIRHLRQEVNLPEDFSEFNLTKDDIEKTILAVQNDPSGIFFRLNAETIRKVGEKVCVNATAASI
ncbi:iron-containing alcohol dehydrogenase [Parageobacillus toebii]|jgi:alcohol dehydrogenase class IV|uniref:iron-containing alcohol dehydrogenase n=1 Tax=Parageobacillus toebii TaxID=153151 RepID=UPI001966F81D|nr:iron-containing alcohol dehydrogenase [Parageobacillus toebii]QSB49564.1 iron-containing alcohol dehydrogenase [Parageobacillus toebii]WMT19698.1 iron-containing alcohol dehydrogenase [Parageobacillus toebii]